MWAWGSLLASYLVRLSALHRHATRAPIQTDRTAQGTPAKQTQNDPRRAAFGAAQREGAPTAPRPRGLRSAETEDPAVCDGATVSADASPGPSAKTSPHLRGEKRIGFRDPSQIRADRKSTRLNS